MERAKLLRWIIAILVILNLGMLVFLFLGRPGRHMHEVMEKGGGPKQIIIERLHLDAEQQKKYDVMVERHRKEMFRLNDVSRGMHDKLYAFLKTDSADTQQTDSLMKQIAENQYQIENLNFNHFKEIRSLCRPEQMDDFNKLVNDLGELFHKGPPPRKQ
jgi:Spy/CpxP family protein refolding chaperone